MPVSQDMAWKIEEKMTDKRIPLQDLGALIGADAILAGAKPYFWRGQQALPPGNKYEQTSLADIFAKDGLPGVLEAIQDMANQLRGKDEAWIGMGPDTALNHMLDDTIFIGIEPRTNPQTAYVNTKLLEQRKLGRTGEAHANATNKTWFSRAMSDAKPLGRGGKQ